MAPIKGRINKNTRKGNTGVQTKTRGQKSKNESSDFEGDSDEESTQSNIENCLDISMKQPLKMCFKLNYKSDSEKLEYSVKKLFSDSDEENLFDCKSDNKEQNVLHDSMKQLKISDKKDRPRRSQKDLNITSARKTRNSSINSRDLQKTVNPSRVTRRSSISSLASDSQKDSKPTPRKTRNSFINPQTSECSTPSRTRLGNKIQDKTPPRSERNLRTLSRISYNEYESPNENTKKRNQTKRESSENELCESPRKLRAQRRNSTVDRKPLASVNEEFSESDSSNVEEFSPEICLRKNTRGRKSIVDKSIVNKSIGNKSIGNKSIVNKSVANKSIVDKDFEFSDEETPRKSKSTITTPRKTPSRITTPAIKRLLTPGKSTPRGSAKKMTPKMLHSLTPGMQRRSVNVSKPKSNLQEFRTRLHVSFIPKSLPCREVEFNNIFTFLKGKLTEQIGGCIYISGVPGTGKTATVNEVINCLKKLESQGELPTFEFIDINGMKLTEPRQAYVQIKKKLTGTASSWEDSHCYLQHRFTTPSSRKNMTLLLIDEMDLLCTKRQDVVYNLLDWPTYKSSHLVVITIANTMDLPERVLMGRVTSRLGLTRLTFQPYNHSQLMEIVKTRLKDMEGFKKEAIELVARKVASVSGDARRALDICRRATEIAESNHKEFVTITDVTSALNEMIANPRVRAIKCCSMMEQKFLEAVCNEVSRIGLEQVTLKNIYNQFETLCLIEGEEVPNITQTLEICRKLASWRLILWESGADLYQSVLLNIAADDIYFSRHKAP